MRGTSIQQDARFVDKTKKMLQNSQWPDKYSNKIDLQKVDIDLIKSWIQRRIYKLLGQEDDIVSGTVISLLDQYIQKGQKPNAKKMHVSLSGFLKEKTLIFISELWDLLDESQKSANGIPQALIQEKRQQQAEEKKKLNQLRKKNEKYQHKKFDHIISRHVQKRNKSRSPERKDRKPEKQRKQRKHRERSRSRDRRHNKKDSHRKDKDRKRERSQIERKKNKRHRRRSYSSASSDSHDGRRSSSQSRSLSKVVPSQKKNYKQNDQLNSIKGVKLQQKHKKHRTDKPQKQKSSKKHSSKHSKKKKRRNSPSSSQEQSHGRSQQNISSSQQQSSSQSSSVVSSSSSNQQSKQSAEVSF